MFMNIRRSGLIVAVLTCASPAGAQEMRAVEIRDFIVGDHFAYTCVDGSTGNGRIYADGSVAGYIRPAGTGPHRYVVLPPGTLQIKGERYCASLRGIAFKPCFNIERIASAVLSRGWTLPTVILRGSALARRSSRITGFVVSGPPWA
jgi:hypothetical protein